MKQLQSRLGRMLLLMLFCATVGSATDSAVTFEGWRVVPGHGTTLVSGSAVSYQGKLYLFGIGIQDHGHYVNVLDGSKWSGWNPVPGGGSTLLPDASAVYKNKLYLFGVGINDHQHYMNVLDGVNWSGWAPVKGGGTTAQPDTAVTFRDKLYLFGIGIADKRHYLNIFVDGIGWSGWAEVPGSGATPVSDAATTYQDKLYLFTVGLNKQHYMNVFDNARWTGWKPLPGGSTTVFRTSAAEWNDKLYLFGIGATDHKHYVASFNGSSWSSWSVILGGAVNAAFTTVAAAVAAHKGTLYLTGIGGEDHQYYVNVIAQLRYNEVYQKSAHNTYKQYEDVLDVLLYHRIRSIEFDLHREDAAADDWWVYHNSNFLSPDVKTSVRHLSDALTLLVGFHRAVQKHEVVTVWIDLEIDANDLGHTAAAFDAALRGRLGGALYTPKDFIKSCNDDWHDPPDRKRPTDVAGLHDSLANGDCRWPTLESLRGRFIFVVANDFKKYLKDSTNTGPGPAAFAADPKDVIANKAVVFGNFEVDGDWQRGKVANDAHFVTRVYEKDANSVESATAQKQAVDNHFHHIATNQLNDDEAPWNRTHNVRGYPFCPLGEPVCDQKLLDYVEGGSSADPLYALTVRSGDLEDGASAKDNFALVANQSVLPNAFEFTGFVAASSSHVNEWAKACLMARGGVDALAPYYAICRTADNHGPFVQYRSLGCTGACPTAYTKSLGDENNDVENNAVFLQLVVTYGTATTTVQGFTSLDHGTWSAIGQAITFPTTLGLVGVGASSHGDTPVKFLFGAMKLAGSGNSATPYRLGPDIYRIGDASWAVLEDVGRPR